MSEPGERKPLDDMDLADLIGVAAKHGDISRAYVMRAAVLGRSAEQRLATFAEQAKIIMEATVWLVRRQERRRAKRLAIFHARRRARRG